MLTNLNKQLQLHIVGGFLGSGKTTAIHQACKYLLEQRIGVGVVTNDQGLHLVDHQFITSLGVPTQQVVNGCFCCRLDDLEKSILSLIKVHQPEVIFAESVGSCTDLIATVLKPLQHYHPTIDITISIFADIRLLHLLLTDASVFEEEVRYVYFKQLEEATLVVLSKLDLVTELQLEETKRLIDQKYPDKILLYQNSYIKSNIQNWLFALQKNYGATKLPSLFIDYITYGKGEELLGWLDQEIEIVSHLVNANQLAIELAKLISQTIQEQKIFIGHLKFLLNQQYKISYTTVPEIESQNKEDYPYSLRAILLINARVQTHPNMLQQIVLSAIECIQDNYSCTIHTNYQKAFQPGFPNPTFRIA